VCSFFPSLPAIFLTFVPSRRVPGFDDSFRAFVDLGKRLKDTPAHAALLVGGTKPTKTVKLLKRNLVDVLIGTPPIIASYMKKGTIQAARCRFFVLDEGKLFKRSVFALKGSSIMVSLNNECARNNSKQPTS
jgi:superfamily II DNA/RNA helicase